MSQNYKAENKQDGADNGDIGAGDYRIVRTGEKGEVDGFSSVEASFDFLGPKDDFGHIYPLEYEGCYRDRYSQDQGACADGQCAWKARATADLV